MLPTDLAELNDDALMEEAAIFTQWANYFASKVAVAEIDEAEAWAKLEKQKALQMIEGWTGARGDRVALAKAEALVGEEAQAMVDAHATAKAYRKLIQTLYENADRGASLLSRELTRRIGLAGKEHRLGKFRP